MNHIHEGPAQAVFEHYHNPDASRALYLANRIKDGKGSIWPHEVLALHHFAYRQQRPGARFVEIGTLIGYSSLVLSCAAPQADILTLNPAEHEVVQARANLAPYPNVRIVQQVSWDYLPEYDGTPIDLLFIDGDHKRCALDMPWWDLVRRGGVALWHDYDAGSPKVIEAVDALCARLGRPLDIRIAPNDCPRGFVGLIKRGGE